ncbi:MAG: trypsin-like peptidase domain-containing protein [Planctomycetes bacterium]|nr:trypsin-like peptidase domain-containing protein [Planctomycetota bacterium]
MAAASRSCLAIGLLGLSCLGVGVVVGRAGFGRAGDPVWAAAPQRAEAPRVVATPSFAPIVERASDGVVAVLAYLPEAAASGSSDAEADTATAPHPGTDVARVGRRLRSGSGFLIHRDGLIVTARHVVVGATELLVSVRQQEPEAAELVGEDAVSDLAVIRLLEPPRDPCVLHLGRSEDLRAGDWVMAIGNPYGFPQTVTAGVVSFVGRHLHNSGFGVTTEFLQFSAAVHRGSSGCPVLDLDGNVVGVTTQSADDAAGLSFAIPSRTAKWVLDELDRSPDGRVRRGFLGVALALRRTLDEHGQPIDGALVTGVAHGGPAERAGLCKGDLVYGIDGGPLASGADFHDRVTRTSPGSSVLLSVMREGERLPPMSVTVASVGDQGPTH